METLITTYEMHRKGLLPSLENSTTNIFAGELIVLGNIFHVLVYGEV
ncbi:hypothetical protein ACQ86N_15910 [Puia sp. P3]